MPYATRPTGARYYPLVWTPLTGRRLVCGGAAALIVAIVTCASGCGLCGNAEVKEYLSPDRTMKVVVFTRDCGATTDFSTQVSVVHASESVPNGGGNAFVVDSDHGHASRAVDVHWVDARTIELSHDVGARVFKAETSVSGIRIVYSTAVPLGYG